MESSKPKVLITGITGFLGSQVCKYFLEDGNYSVRGTVRNKNDERKMKPIQHAFGENNFSKLELFEADLLNPESLDNAIQGCDYVVHTASPLPAIVPKDENVLIRPAVEGTLSILRSCVKHKIKRIVITSSSLTMCVQPSNKKPVYNEEDWSDPNSCAPYDKSKTLAERAAWDFHSQLSDQEKFELVVINPAFIQGPALVQTDFSSGIVVRKIMNGDIPGAPKVMFPVVDVRDVALAHLRAIQVKEAANHRFILSDRSMWFKEMAQVLAQKYPSGFKINTSDIKYCTLKFASWFDASAKTLLPFWGLEFEMDNQKSKTILGIQYRPASEAVIEMAESLIQSGLLRSKKKTQCSS
ncbi:nad-dependent epimerase dehydratase [Stylonychia lemnae]|uniref:Nad-dependent epimerase dehydratase n=1 Tax=Stylonychia lemnae TaxID=5949 RepID=A0A078ART9_STYLE|nr:nad-dependent epimerase dehydratase [Stylonychia lemnae]|eukprot:CDW84889.1 nad-dependent epimerase dehydratase [Stylonychia lemnae]